MSKRCKDIELWNIIWLCVLMLISLYLYTVYMFDLKEGVGNKTFNIIIMWCSFIFLIICIIFLIIGEIMFGFVEYNKSKCRK